MILSWVYFASIALFDGIQNETLAWAALPGTLGLLACSAVVAVRQYGWKSLALVLVATCAAAGLALVGVTALLDV